MNKQSTSIPKNSPQYIKSLLYVNNRAVERAMIALYMNKVSPDETLYYSTWVNIGKALSGFHLEKARMIALANIPVLVKAATKKLQEKRSKNN